MVGGGYRSPGSNSVSLQDNPVSRYLEMNAEKEKAAIKGAADFVKAIVQPYITMSSWTVCLIMWLSGAEPPLLLLGVAGIEPAKFVGSQAIKKLKK